VGSAKQAPHYVFVTKTLNATSDAKSGSAQPFTMAQDCGPGRFTIAKHHKKSVVPVRERAGHRIAKRNRLPLLGAGTVC